MHFHTSSSSLSELLSLGEHELAAGNHIRAAEVLNEASDLVPGDITIAQLAANSWLATSNRYKARRVLERALTPSALTQLSDVEAYNLGARCLDVGAPDLALQCFAVTARHRAGNAALLGAMASAHRSLGELDEAWRLAKLAVEKDKKNPALLLTAAQVRHAQGNYDEAMSWLKRAETVRPFHSPTRLQRAYTRLIQGVSRAGWEDFEHRGLPSLPEGSEWWLGGDLDGKSIRVVMEQGVGDLFHFLRFVPLLADRGARKVIVEAPEKAVSLLEASGFSSVSKQSGERCDYAVPLLSLPLRLELGSQTLGEETPYLRIDHIDHTGTSEAPSRSGVRSGGRKRLGLVIKGNPDFLATNLRDIDEQYLKEFQAIEGVDWVWLQFGQNPPQDFRCEIVQMSAYWRDSAQILSSLDGLVAVDTGLAHLAGAMGLPVYILLPFSPDWRWKSKGDRVSWYPSATLIRQLAPRDWTGAIQLLSTAINTPA